MKNHEEFLLRTNAIVSKVIETFPGIGTPHRKYELDKIPPIKVTDENPNAIWKNRTSRQRSKSSHAPSEGLDVRISQQLINERARLLDPRPLNILNNVMYTLEGLNRTTANQRVGVATAVLTLEAIISSHKYESPTQVEYENLGKVLQDLGYKANFSKR